MKPARGLEVEDPNLAIATRYFHLKDKSKPCPGTLTVVGLLLVASLVHLLYLAVTKSKTLQISLLLRTAFPWPAPWDGWWFQCVSIVKPMEVS